MELFLHSSELRPQKFDLFIKTVILGLGRRYVAKGAVFTKSTDTIFGEVYAGLLVPEGTFNNRALNGGAGVDGVRESAVASKLTMTKLMELAEGDITGLRGHSTAELVADRITLCAWIW